MCEEVWCGGGGKLALGCVWFRARPRGLVIVSGSGAYDGGEGEGVNA